MMLPKLFSGLPVDVTYFFDIKLGGPIILYKF